MQMAPVESPKRPPEEDRCAECRKPIVRFWRNGVWSGWEHYVEPSGHPALASSASISTRSAPDTGSTPDVSNVASPQGRSSVPFDEETEGVEPAAGEEADQQVPPSKAEPVLGSYLVRIHLRGSGNLEPLTNQELSDAISATLKSTYPEHSVRSERLDS